MPNQWSRFQTLIYWQPASDGQPAQAADVSDRLLDLKWGIGTRRPNRLGGVSSNKARILLILDNRDGVLDQNNPGVIDGVQVNPREGSIIVIRDSVADSIIMAGFQDKYIPTYPSARNVVPIVTISAIGPLERLEEYYSKIYSPRTGADDVVIDTDAAFHLVLDAAGWPRDWAIPGLLARESSGADVQLDRGQLDAVALRASGGRSSALNALNLIAQAELGWVSETHRLGIKFEGYEARGNTWKNEQSLDWSIPSSKVDFLDESEGVVNEVQSTYDSVQTHPGDSFTLPPTNIKRLTLGPRQSSFIAVDVDELGLGFTAVRPWLPLESGDYSFTVETKPVFVPPAPPAVPDDTPPVIEPARPTLMDRVPTFGTGKVDSVRVQTGTRISISLPRGTGGDGTLRYTVSPALPSGLSFDTGAFRITGTVTSAVAARTYTYTVFDQDGDTDERNFVIEVFAPPPTPPPADKFPTFGTKTQATLYFRQGTPSTAVTLPSATGGDGTLTYSLTPALPNGLTFNASRRQISGTPTVSASPTTYTLTVTDADGDTATLSFTIRVWLPVPGTTTTTTPSNPVNVNTTMDDPEPSEPTDVYPAPYHAYRFRNIGRPGLVGAVALVRIPLFPFFTDARLYIVNGRIRPIRLDTEITRVNPDLSVETIYTGDPGGFLAEDFHFGYNRGDAFIFSYGRRSYEVAAGRTRATVTVRNAPFLNSTTRDGRNTLVSASVDSQFLNLTYGINNTKRQIPKASIGLYGDASHFIFLSWDGTQLIVTYSDGTKVRGYAIRSLSNPRPVQLFSISNRRDLVSVSYVGGKAALAVIDNRHVNTDIYVSGAISA